jgi:hypothetical protein
MIVIIIGEMTIVNEVKFFFSFERILHDFSFVKMIAVVVLVDHRTRIHQLDKNPNENHLVQVHPHPPPLHHHHVIHLDRMFNSQSLFLY